MLLSFFVLLSNRKNYNASQNEKKKCENIIYIHFHAHKLLNKLCVTTRLKVGMTCDMLNYFIYTYKEKFI